MNQDFRATPIFNLIFLFSEQTQYKTPSGLYIGSNSKGCITRTPSGFYKIFNRYYKKNISFYSTPIGVADINYMFFYQYPTPTGLLANCINEKY